MRLPRVRPLRVLTTVAIVLGGYLGITFVSVWRASSHDGARPAEAIVVLGAAQYDGRPSAVLRARLDHALELWRAETAPLVVVTGGRQPGDRFTEAAAGYAYLRDRGVPDAAILAEVSGSNSWEELAAAARFLSARDVDEVVLVSDGYHARRLDAIADEVGMDASVSPADTGSSWWANSRALGRETLAVAVGRLIGYHRLARLTEAIAG